MFDSYEEKMLMLGDFDLNSMQQYTDSLKDIFKQTMLEQEIIFRKQVHELHHLYSVQKTLMKGLAPMELEKNKSWKANAQSYPQETILPTNSISRLGSRVSSGQELLEGWRGNCQKFQQRPFNLQLLPDQYISLGDNNPPNKGKVGDHLKETMDIISLHGGFSDPLELRLSLSLGMVKGKKEDKQRNWYDKKVNTCSGIVIDLEESAERTSDEGAKHPPIDFAAKGTYSGGRHDSQVTITSDPITSRSMEKDLSHEIAENSSLVGDSKCCQEWSYSDQGLKHPENMPCKNFLTRKQQFISYGVGYLDLNEVRLDDSSCHSNDAIGAHPLTTSSSGGFSGLISRSQETLCPTTFWREEIKELSNDTSEMLQQDDCVKLSLLNSNNKDGRTETKVQNSKLSGRNECETSLIGPASVSRPQINLPKDIGIHNGNTKNGRDELMLKLQNVPALGPNPPCVVDTQLGCEKPEEGDTVLCSDKIQITIEDEHPDESPASGKSSCISDNDSSPVRTMQSGIEPYNSSLPASDQFSGTHGRSQVAETLSGEQDQRSSDSNEIKHECYNNREKSAEVDDLIQIAAESLIRVSLENSACYRESSTQTGSNELENEDKEQPQRSSDSFELMTLKLTEICADDYSVSSKPFEVCDAESKDFSIKLRRGRRLKDFQRDILPGLASLSRHEIREDINILEGVLRSREYKKMRAKMANGESWCTPVRSRRSRLNYVGRKTFR
ncbi:uncharacterized protein LOC111290686 [Durio zibethinus]|uniref:Uncharacterized protein LOC111290686 n=1 Tax=Durio zibethinus TaxID=66656 RepID=A0A6P5YBE4_DURZI|nr:uncharacterized protein LOC111290686 [Durio zibethinus]